MDENFLIRISLCFFIVGLFLLAGICLFTKPAGDNIYSDQEVTYKGQVLKIAQGKNFTRISVERNEKTDVVIFENLAINLNKGDLIEIRGKTQKNKYGFSIIADEIRRID